ncbi:MAG: Fis family transcriptional regulator [endosymbiont of Galathealinum brachiosum]|uniref:Fis family transcriptional regulator n=1 Tax=endosymbiont of Galathealinum brachiosum TaxID=2200906 RepID=A0A370DEM3_9GAMM|nr:MAG: Fis family transcriptional regulator [endosymbiont of Galathealinum brachiosum]
MSNTPKKPSCETLISLFPDPFVIIDRQFQIVAANQKYRDHYKQEDIVGKHCYEVSHGIDRPCSQNGEHCPLEEVVQTGKPTSVMHIHCNCDHEEHVQLSAAPIFDDDGNVQYMGESIQPVSEEPENEQVLLGRSKAALRLMSILYRVAPTSSTVLLLGESGVGKDCAARYVHQNSSRADENFVVVDCGVLGENMIESELFGHEKGAFTGANKLKIGLFESADKGTLFIDEIGELPLHLQTKLLRVLETGTIRRLGGNDYIDVDVRIIAATNREPQQMIKDKTFREDLYYRLCAFPVNLPPLRSRKGDIPLLAESFLKHMEEGESQIPLSPEVIEKLLSYEYPGNIRELKNIIERALILSAGTPIMSDFLVFEHEQEGFVVNETPSRYSPTAKRTGTSRLSRDEVLKAVEKCGGHRSQAALMLGVSERTIYRHLKD